MEKLKISDFRDNPAAQMMIFTFPKETLFLTNYKNILKEIGLEIKSERNPFYKTNLEEGISFGCNKNFDVEIIYLSGIIVLIVRYMDIEAKKLFLRILYKYAE